MAWFSSMSGVLPAVVLVLVVLTGKTRRCPGEEELIANMLARSSPSLFASFSKMAAPGLLFCALLNMGVRRIVSSSMVDGILLQHLVVVARGRDFALPGPPEKA